MLYTFYCPVKGCEHKISAKALSETEALGELKGQAKTHGEGVHPDLRLTPQELEDLVRANMIQESQMAPQNHMVP